MDIELPSTVGNVSDSRYVSYYRTRGCEFDPWPVHTIVEIYHEISTAVLLPSIDSRRVVVSYKQKYVHEVLFNHLVKLAKEKVWLGALTVQTWSW